MGMLGLGEMSWWLASVLFVLRFCLWWVGMRMDRALLLHRRDPTGPLLTPLGAVF